MQETVKAGTSLGELSRHPLFGAYLDLIIRPFPVGEDLSSISVEEATRRSGLPVETFLASLEVLRKRFLSNKSPVYRFGPSRGLISFLNEKTGRPFLLLAGGGYGEVCTLNEAYPFLPILLKKGYDPYVLLYDCVSNPILDRAIEDVERSLELIRKEEGGDVPFTLMGFSAGGHLAADYAAVHQGDDLAPRNLILAYPVITMDLATHGGSREHLLGSNPSKELRDAHSVEKRVTPSYPRTYLWQFYEDPIVPAKNSILLDEALNEASVAHVTRLEHGPYHGTSLSLGTDMEGWFDEALRFCKW